MKKRILLILLISIILLVLMSSVAFAADEMVGGTPDFWEYIKDEALVLVPALYLIGWIIKKIPKIPDWIIPIVLMTIAVPAAMGLIGWTIDGAIQGILVAGVTVLTNQVYKQTAVKRIE